ncbi:MAG: S24 family peptidase [Casimicrobiaceae bacterium]
MSERKIVPINPAPATGGDCSGAEPFALMVLGDSMQPEFVEGEVIVVEPEGLATDGSYVIAQVDDEWTFRQLTRTAECWRLTALNPAYPPVDLADLTPIRGVVIQKSKPGRRRALRRYVD